MEVKGGEEGRREREERRWVGGGGQVRNIIMLIRLLWAENLNAHILVGRHPEK